MRHGHGPRLLVLASGRTQNPNQPHLGKEKPKDALKPLPEAGVGAEPAQRPDCELERAVPRGTPRSSSGKGNLLKPALFVPAEAQTQGGS